MHVNLIAWALTQALPADQRAILSLMALLTAEAGTGTVFVGNMAALSVCSLQPEPLVRRSVEALVDCGLLRRLRHGFQLEVGRLAA